MSLLKLTNNPGHDIVGKCLIIYSYDMVHKLVHIFMPQGPENIDD